MNAKKPMRSGILAEPGNLGSIVVKEVGEQLGTFSKFLKTPTTIAQCV